MKRSLIQIASALASNGYLRGFAEASIYQGPAKGTCVTFLNCYSCPGALASCPVGAFQSLLANGAHTVSMYVGGFLVAVGALGGRFVCGWLCPFGLLQDVAALIARPRRHLPGWTRWPKFFILALTVTLPALVVGEFGLGQPYFCKFLCPAGTLEGGLLLALRRPELRGSMGLLFGWKVLLLLGFLVTSFLVYRPFCRAACPLGAFYGLFNGRSLWRFEIRADLCNACERCSRACPMGLDPRNDANGPECIRCMECSRACQVGAIMLTGRGDGIRALHSTDNGRQDVCSRRQASGISGAPQGQ